MAVWAITAYFNPARFRRRYANYQAFRKALGLPLLTVEWSSEASFDLTDADADKLIRISGGDLMWQKERLLNIAISQLPPECDQVAWFDSDVVFPDSRWMSDISAALEHAVIIQLFSQVIHLPSVPPESIDPETMHQVSALLIRDALAYTRNVSSQPSQTDAPCSDSMGRAALTDGQREVLELKRLSERPSSGHAWAARRELLTEHGLYDACICGVGDMATALAALGQPQTFVDRYPLNDAQKAHYLSWAERFGSAVAGRVGCLPRTIFHLFHGRMVDRQYHRRLNRLAGSGFDPDRHIRCNAQGAWEWAARDDALAQFMVDYFRDRREDSRTGFGKYWWLGDRSSLRKTPVLPSGRTSVEPWDGRSDNVDPGSLPPSRRPF